MFMDREASDKSLEWSKFTLLMIQSSPPTQRAGQGLVLLDSIANSLHSMRCFVLSAQLCFLDVLFCTPQSFLLWLHYITAVLLVNAG